MLSKENSSTAPGERAATTESAVSLSIPVPFKSLCAAAKSGKNGKLRSADAARATKRVRNPVATGRASGLAARALHSFKYFLFTAKPAMQGFFISVKEFK